MLLESPAKEPLSICTCQRMNKEEINKTILLVDDDHDDQLLFMLALEEIGKKISCHVANNGQEALSMLTDTLSPDLIFLDLNMPVMNGFDFLAEREKDERIKNIPVVIFSTTSDLGTVKKTYEMGASVFFKKPNDFPTLRTKLNSLFEKLHPVISCPGTAFSFTEFLL